MLGSSATFAGHDPKKPKPKPNQPPTVSLTAPGDGDTFIAPATIMLRAKARDKDGHVKSVKFYSGTTLLFTCEHEPPYSNNWVNVPPGTHVLTAVVTDDEGASTTSTPVKISVNPNELPTVMIASPAEGADFPAGEPIMVNADAHDTDGKIRRVRFYADGKPIGQADRHAPYTIMWRRPKPGQHALTAVAVDDKHGETTSPEVHITVDEAEPPAAPVVSITDPTEGQVFQAGASVPLAANASVTGGATLEVQFFVDGSPVGAPDTSAPYQATFNAAPAGNHTVKAKATSSAGPSTTSADVHFIVNAPPTVTLAVTGAPFTDPATIQLSAEAHDPDGDATITQVDFYRDLNLLSTDSAAPFEFDVTGAAAGSYSFTAVVTDNHGGTGESNEVSVTVDAAPNPNPDPTTAPLVQQANLVYEGAFRVPDNGFDGFPGEGLTDWQKERASFNYGGTALAYNPVYDSLFIVGHDQAQLIAEISIPEVFTNIVNSSSIRQLFIDSAYGICNPGQFLPNGDPVCSLDTINPTSPNVKKVGGLLPFGGHLYISAYDYYDGNGTQKLSDFVHGLDFTMPTDVTGPFRVDQEGCQPAAADDYSTPEPGCLRAGYFSGYFAVVPPEWQSEFGFVLKGNCCLGVISRTSRGPSISKVDLSTIGNLSFAPAKPLVLYPGDHPLLEEGMTPCVDPAICNPLVDGWGNTSTLFNGTTEIRGVVFPQNTRSVLFFGRQGVGTFCYGPGTDDPALVGTPAPPDGVDNYCFDPDDGSKGVHAYPYKYQVWGYDANDLASVKSGAKQPWEVRPYATWNLDFPFPADGIHIGGAAYDPVTGRIFISQMFADGPSTARTLPLIHQFKVQFQP